MKKVLLLSLAVALVMAPFALRAQVESVAGSMTLGAHIDFAGRYSAEDLKDPDIDEVYWAGYETFNLEAAILYVMGQVGDNVDYVIGYALAMPSAAGGIVTPAAAATLLDAKIVLAITDSIALNMGRYIPATSMSQQPHQLSVHRLNNPPMMIAGGDYNPVLIPLPRYQTGIGIQAGMGPATVSWDVFNGNEVALVDNVSDVDKSKGGALKVAVDSGSLHGGIWYMSEYSDVPGGLVIPIGGFDVGLDDNLVSMYGVEIAYVSERFFVCLEYLSSTLDLLDTDVPDLNQTSYYVMAGAGVGPVVIVVRYDYAEAGIDQFIDDIDGMEADEDSIGDQQTNITLGVIYDLNDNTSASFNYAMRQPEEPDGITLPNIDEVSILVEVDVL